jgi:hypothetical protein
MAVRLALHIQGLPVINYETLKLVANHSLNIPTVCIRRIVEMLAEVEFVKLQTERKTIKAVVPNVPYYEGLYSTLGDFGASEGFNEAEQLSIDVLCRLSRRPENVDALRSSLGAESALMWVGNALGKSVIKSETRPPISAQTFLFQLTDRALGAGVRLHSQARSSTSA